MSTTISERDTRDLLMEFGYDGIGASSKIGEMRHGGRLELADEGAGNPGIILTREGGEWITRHQR